MKMNDMLKLGSILGLFVCSILDASVIRIPGDYPTIQMGIDSAVRHDTISIAADSFHECIEIYKPLTIMGAGIDSTVITPPDTASSGMGYDWNIHVKADSVRVMRLSQCGAYWCPGSLSKVGVRIDSCEGGSIEDCVISENCCPEPIKASPKPTDGPCGIFILNSSSFSVIRSTVNRNCHSGVRACDSRDILLQDNVVSENCGVYCSGPGGPAFGVILERCSSALVGNNSILGTYGNISATGCGISLDSCGHITIENNRIFGSSGGPPPIIDPGSGGNAFGVSVNGCEHILISHNVISSTSAGDGRPYGPGNAFGVLVERSSDTEITQNTISGTKGGWELSYEHNRLRVQGDGTGIECWGVPCVIDRNAIMDNQCGARIHAADVSIEECNFYFNTYQRYPTTPGENYELQTDSIVSAINNFWWYIDSTSIDSLIDGPAGFVPFATAPIDSAPGEPSAVTSVRMFSDTAYSIPFTVPAKRRDCLYIELQGVDWNNRFIDPAIVIVTSKKAPLGIGVALIETGTATSVYRGCAQIDTMSNDVWNMIGADPGDTVIVCANVDLARCDTVVVEGAGVEEEGNDQLAMSNGQLSILPNPFIRSTIIEYHVPVKANISLSIYDITGRTVQTLANEEKESGKHEVRWDAKGLATGVYFAKLVVYGCDGETKKLILVK